MGPWFCGTKSALLHDFAGQSLHCFIILRGKDKVWRAKTQQKRRFSYFFKIHFDKWMLFKRSIAPWWKLFTKKKHISGPYILLIRLLPPAQFSWEFYSRGLPGRQGCCEHLGSRHKSKFNNVIWNFNIDIYYKLDGVGPVDNRPSTD